MKVLNYIFPIKLYLSIFQLEGYNLLRFIAWLSKNFLSRSLPQKRKLIPTLKTQLLLLMSFLLLILLLIYLNLSLNSLFLATVITIIVSTQFYIPLLISRTLLYPFELFIIKISVWKTNKKLKSLNGLKVIAITGSYGKTSVKEILYQLIKDDYKTLRTPESFNTTLGISKVVDYELDRSYQYFICEMAAYHRGDIKRLCAMIPPDFGILTGITTQHLERFGGLNNIIKTKFELYEAFRDNKDLIINLNDSNINQEVKRRGIQNPNGYLQTSNVRFSNAGSSFDIEHNRKKYPVQTSLFGISNVENLAGAITMATKIGIPIERLIEKSKNIVPVTSRFVLKHLNRATIVDNTFSSNEHSFKEMIETAKLVKGSKALITPGLVELGEDEDRINSSIGKMSEKVFDKTILVGKNSRTAAFARDLKEKPRIIPDTRKDYFEKIEELSKTYDWIFLENDITENY